MSAPDRPSGTGPRVVAVIPLYDPPPSPDPGFAALTAALDACLVIDNRDDGHMGGYIAALRHVGATVVEVPRAPSRCVATALAAGLAWCVAERIDWMWCFDQDAFVDGPFDPRALVSRLDGEERLGALFSGHRAEPSIIDLMFSGTLFSVRALAAVSGPDPGFPVDLCDTDLAIRLADAGWTVASSGDLSPLGHSLGDGRPLRIGRRTLTASVHSPARWRGYGEAFVRLVRKHGRRHPGTCLVITKRTLERLVLSAIVSPLTLPAISFALVRGLVFAATPSHLRVRSRS